jgi:hypothetical protein
MAAAPAGAAALLLVVVVVVFVVAVFAAKEAPPCGVDEAPAVAIYASFFTVVVAVVDTPL